MWLWPHNACIPLVQAELKQHEMGMTLQKKYLVKGFSMNVIRVLPGILLSVVHKVAGRLVEVTGMACGMINSYCQSLLYPNLAFQ